MRRLTIPVLSRSVILFTMITFINSDAQPTNRQRIDKTCGISEIGLTEHVSILCKPLTIRYDSIHEQSPGSMAPITEAVIIEIR
ncbi:hypothetical protein V1506DRAFT_542432 [Lipomyces tetrasporus]